MGVIDIGKKIAGSVARVTHNKVEDWQTQRVLNKVRKQELYEKAGGRGAYYAQKIERAEKNARPLIIIGQRAAKAIVPKPTRIKRTQKPLFQQIPQPFWNDFDTPRKTKQRRGGKEWF